MQDYEPALRVESLKGFYLGMLQRVTGSNTLAYYGRPLEVGPCLLNPIQIGAYPAYPAEAGPTEYPLVKTYVPRLLA